MSGEENTKDFMDFINNISPIDNTEKKVEEKNESMESYTSQSDDSLKTPISTLKNTKEEDEGNIAKRIDNEITLKENTSPSFQTTKEEVKDILKNIEEIKQFFSELKLNAKRDIESYTDEVLVSWQNYHAEILNKSNIKDLVTNNEKKKKNFILLYIISFLNLFFIIFLIFIIFKTK